jgi:uncharacterized protein (DUF58 family)
VRPIFKILYRFYRFYSWLRYVASRRFTRAGLGVCFALGAAAILGPDTDNNVSYQAFSLLLFLLLVAISFSWSFRVRFAATRVLPRFGTAGQPFSYKVILENLGRKTETGLTLLENLADPRPQFDEWFTVQRAHDRQLRSFRLSQGRRTTPFRQALTRESLVSSSASQEQTEVRIELTPLRRGPLRFTGITLARPDPLGLFRAFHKIPLSHTALILPRRYPLPPIALPGTHKYQQGGVAFASNVGQSEDFVSLRDYRYGDPLRHIHWRSWAKAGKPVVKEFEDEFFVRHALVLDTFKDPPGDEVFEEAVSVAASFACAIPNQESLLDLLFVGPESYCFTAGRGLAHEEQMLEILASVRPCSDRPFNSLEHLVLSHLELVSGCICVLVGWTEERRKFVEKLQAYGVPLMVLLIVGLGAKEGVDPGPMRVEPDRFHVLEAGDIQRGLARLT